MGLKELKDIVQQMFMDDFIRPGDYVGSITSEISRIEAELNRMHQTNMRMMTDKDAVARIAQDAQSKQASAEIKLKQVEKANKALMDLNNELNSRLEALMLSMMKTK